MRFSLRITEDVKSNQLRCNCKRDCTLSIAIVLLLVRETFSIITPYKSIERNVLCHAEPHPKMILTDEGREEAEQSAWYN